MSLSAEQIARICHEANRAYCSAIGDDSQKPWDEAEGWQRDSAVTGVATALHLALSPEAQHEAWMKDKLDAGWTHGDVKDPTAKTHPCLVPYAELPSEQRLKDRLFVAVVDAFRAD